MENTIVEKNSEEEKFFVDNAFFFFRNADRILKDSRMFLAPVPIRPGRAFFMPTGVTLGACLEWWSTCETHAATDNKGNAALIYDIAGSPLTGSCSCACVYPDGSRKSFIGGSFIHRCKEFYSICNRYSAAQQKHEAYSLQEVKEHLMQGEESRPHKNSFKVGDAALWGGEYPFDLDPERGEEKVQKALDFGITHFIDLTKEGELKPYEQLLKGRAEYLRFPIKDINVPNSVKKVHDLILRMDEILSHPDHKIYLHCWGGVGRTGTIAACWLAYKEKLSFDATMQRLWELWAQNPKSAKRREIPDTYAQELFVQDYIKYLNSRPLLWNCSYGKR